MTVTGTPEEDDRQDRADWMQESAGETSADASAPSDLSLSPADSGERAGSDSSTAAATPRSSAEASDSASASAPGWARVMAILSLVAGIIGVGLGWIPVIGRMLSFVCGAVGVITGVVAVQATPAGVKGSRHAVAIAGLTLACVCVFQALRLTGCSALTDAATDAAGDLVSGIVS